MENIHSHRDIREAGKNVSWNCIVITCSDPRWRDHTEKEAKKLAKAGLLPSHDLLLVVDDPQVSLPQSTNNDTSCGVGSGGATLNALLIVTERLSALAGDTTINSDILFKSLILMIHFGRSSYHYPGGNAFLPVNKSSSWIPLSITTPTSPVLLQHVMWMASVLASKSSHGVWITSLDFFIPFSQTVSLPSTNGVVGALVMSLRQTNLRDKSTEYGYLRVGPDGGLEEIVYKRNQTSDGDTLDDRVICGISYVSPSLAEKLLSLYTLPPLDRCTYYGTDTASDPVQVSLYFDLLLPLCSNTNKEKYLSGELSFSYARRAKYNNNLMFQEGIRARHNMWSQLRSYSAFEHQLNIDFSSYINPSNSFSNTLEGLMNHESIQSNSLTLNLSSNVETCNSRVDCCLELAPECKVTFFDCILGQELVLKAAGDCIVSGIHHSNGRNMTVFLGNRVLWQRWPLEGGDAVVSCHGFDDLMTVDQREEEFTILGRTWSDFSCAVGGLACSDLWDAEERSQSLIKAKLFPTGMILTEQMALLGSIMTSLQSGVTSELTQKWRDSKRMSFQDVLLSLDVGRLFRSRENTFVSLVERLIRDTSRHRMGPALLPFFKYATAISTEKALVLLDCFHEVLQGCPPTSSRLLANVADLLGCLGGPRGGLRSGPAANNKWMPALLALRSGDYRSGIAQMEIVCEDFLRSSRPEDIIRASRHYERASHILIAKQVETVRNEVFPLTFSEEGDTPEPLNKGVWVEASCPARLDLAGGWTDTPPVCYELGGAVLNVAIKVNGKKPLGSKAKLTENLTVVCHLKDASGTELRIVWKELDELRDYDNPVSPGTLVKACLVYTRFVDVEHKSKSLKEQLRERYNGGLEIVTWSELPHGSGLGGSTILAGTILASIIVLMGFDPPDTHKLIHATLNIEQMMTTGGGWQDAVGGLVGGVKLGVSKPQIPLVVETFSVPVDQGFLQFFNQRLFLIFTGQVRLARNLLQKVLRNWYAREETITNAFSHLRDLALEAGRAAISKDGPQLGLLIDKYWDLKKTVASGCEPAKVSDLMTFLRPFVFGQSLAGAGGGGFLFALLSSEPDRLCSSPLQATRFEDMKTYPVEVDVEGLQVHVGGTKVMEAGCEGTCQLTSEMVDLFQEAFRQGGEA